MTVSRSVSWDDAKKKRRRLAVVMALVLVLLPRATRASGETDRSVVRVIVVSASGRLDEARTTVTAAGATVTEELGLIDALVADVPAGAVDEIRAASSVRAVTPDVPLELSTVADTYDPATDPGSLSTTAHVIGADTLWSQGITGRGIDVALIDSGVVSVDGLAAPGKVVDGPDLSDQAGDPAVRHQDTYGHGTHMAGVIAGRDGDGQGAARRFTGIAPDARIVSVKVAGATGATNLSRVVDAITWVIAHRHANGLDIRVLNLSFGALPQNAAVLDPLVDAVDAAWDAGIVVVVAAGNHGAASGGLDTPGRAPRVITVGADDAHGSVTTADDAIPEWSSSGDGVRDPDLVAPGRSIVSLRDPGSYLDEHYPGGRVGDRFFRGSGTSISTAVVSGAAALLLQQRPELTPDQVKDLLVATADPLAAVDASRQGAGVVDVDTAAAAPTPAPRPPSVAAEGAAMAASPSSSQQGDNGSWSGNSWSGNSWSFVEGGGHG